MLFAIPNLASSRISECKPWEVRSVAPPKTDWNRPDVEHAFYSGFEGEFPSTRIESKNNPAVALHWLVADYDGDIDQHARDSLIELSVDFRPQYICRTTSGGARLLWKLEEPFPLHNIELTRRLMRYVRKKMKLSKLLGGFETGAFENPDLYYEAGSDWIQLSDDEIPASYMMQWSIESSDGYKWNKLGLSIPMEIVARAVNRHFPGRWQGDFQIGTRVVCFWVPDADNLTTAVVRESGMQCFEGTQAFVPWSSIFGQRFVKQFKEDRIARSVEKIYHDGRDYWLRHPNKNWICVNKGDLIMYLKVDHKLRNRAMRGETASEIDYALCLIRDHQHIDCASPLVHRPDGIVQVNNHCILNISSVKMLQPADVSTAWSSSTNECSFPWLRDFFEGFFDPSEQLEYFYAWLKRWYESALNKRMEPGQAAFFAGDPNCGKTLLTNVILSRIFGGHADASSFLSGEDSFNSHLFTKAVWTVDDVVPLSNRRSHMKFSSHIKKVAANRTFSVREKYRVDQFIEWNGRIAVTCNTDPESIRILPDVDLSNRDKINLFRTAKRSSFVFPDNVVEIIVSELPFFLRWLLDWPPPEHVVGDTRFGVKTYCEDSLLEAARNSSSAYSFLEVMLKFFEGQDEDFWQGSATELLSSMLNDDDGLARIASRYSPTSVGRELSKLASQNYPLTQHRNGTKRIWTINVAAFK
ncbi:hypothetical protein P4B35_22800 [Pontiellaceae bacterium B12227]|nr:hypothetical protein [Pontiellaceae bacterium B12227]